MRLTTARLVLRPATLEDLGPLHAIFRDPVVMRYWSRPPHTDLEETRQWLRSMIDAPPEQSADFIIEHEGRTIGKAGFHRLPEIGFILGADYWGRGLAREAVTAVIAHVFDERGVQRIEADVDPRNEPSLRLLQRLGFEERGRASRTYQVGDEWTDSVYLSLEPTSFRRR
jgi:RimJ/RimL family protein N-acetyltransferase